MDHFVDFNDIVDKLKVKKRKINLLIGNGFSMSYDPKIFSYNALADFVQKINDPTLTTLFDVLKTKNFELIMEHLSGFSQLLEALGADDDLKQKISNAHTKLKTSLLDAIKSLHPKHVFEIPQENINNCAKFLQIFIDSEGHLFSTNYDLLLYWVLMRGNFNNAVDGFGRDLLNPVESTQGDEFPNWSELRWGPNKHAQNVHYVHGALPFFDVRTDIVKEQYNEEGFLLENIGARLDKGEYPIFVTAGSGDEKLDLIRHNNYLSRCYDNLCEVDGSVITFGFGFGSYDEHIIKALNEAAHFKRKTPPKLWSIYIGVFSEDDKKYIQSIEKKFHMKVSTFDVKSVNPWH